MPAQYVSDDKTIIGLQGLRTVRREDRPWAAPDSKWILYWSYKGQEHSYHYDDQAARDQMYDALRAALDKQGEPKRDGGYRKIDAIKMVRETGNSQGLNIGLNASKAIVEALEPIMRPGDAV